MSEPTVQVGMFGGLQVLREGQVVASFHTAKPAALLAYLACHRSRAHTREGLLELLWPELSQASGANKLSLALARLRSQLEPPDVPTQSILRADRNTIAITAQVTTDVAQFEALIEEARHAEPSGALRLLDEAHRLYSKGTFLDGFDDPWIVAEKERLAALHEELLAERERLLEVVPASYAPQEGASRPIFGREEELQKLRTLLQTSDHVLVQLVGQVGVGKTQLLSALARDLQRSGRCTVALSLREVAAEQVVLALTSAVVQATGQRFEGRGEGLSALVRLLQRLPEPILLLDHVEEHWEERTNTLLQALRQSVPTLSIVLASRKAVLGTEAVLVALKPFLVPSTDQAVQARAGVLIQEWPSIALFVERARRVLPTWRLTTKNVPSVVKIVALLQGVPLAIELVAARVGTRSLGRILSDLSASHDLQSVVAWSIQQLSSRQRYLLMALSVLRGPWRETDAEVVADASDIAFTLSQLVDLALLVATTQGETACYMLPSAVAAQVSAGLMGPVQSDLSARHADYFCGLIEAARTALGRSEEGAVVLRVDAAVPNLLAAMEWSLTHDPATALRLGVAITPFWRRYGQEDAVREYLLRALGQAKGIDRGIYGKALYARGVVEMELGLYDDAIATFLQSRTLWERRGDRSAITATEANLSLLYSKIGKYDIAWMYGESVLSTYRKSNDTLRIGGALNALGVIALNQSRLSEARSLLEESLKIVEQLNQIQECLCRRNLSVVLYLLGEVDRAVDLLFFGLKIALEQKNSRLLTIIMLNYGIFLGTTRSSERVTSMIDASLKAKVALKIDLPEGIYEAARQKDLFLKEQEAEILARSETGDTAEIFLALEHLALELWTKLGER